MSGSLTAPAWLVLPTYNEAANIEGFVEAVRAKLPASTRALIVDDDSPDGTGELADGLAATVDGVSVLHRGRKKGFGPAYIAGFRRVLEAVDLDSIRSRGYAFQVELTYRAIRLGFRVLEVPIVFRDRAVGSSKMIRSIVAEAAWRVPLLRFDRRI